MEDMGSTESEPVQAAHNLGWVPGHMCLAGDFALRAWVAQVVQSAPRIADRGYLRIAAWPVGLVRWHKIMGRSNSSLALSECYC